MELLFYGEDSKSLSLAQPFFWPWDPSIQQPTWNLPLEGVFWASQSQRDLPTPPCKVWITVTGSPFLTPSSPMLQSLHPPVSNSLIFLSFFFFWPPLAACGILLPQPGIEPMPLQWKHGVLTTGPLGKSFNISWIWILLFPLLLS